MKNYLVLSALLLTTSVHAGYQVLGPIEAEDCYDFGVSVCSTKTVTEVRERGKRFSVSDYFNDVSEYHASKGLCIIRTKSKGMGILSWGINALKQPEFWGYDKNGQFGKIDADYIRFKCIKR